ncbi:MAG: NYN domain-containing protein [Nitrospirae bacterium]|nr:NYN domain-containing protein [Nitrospirota bacterium]MCL5977570.1 NYN domain-containing protein [Nitrospirota bacterium]
MQPGIGRYAISHIIIDGYNVIGIFHKDMEKARDSFIDLLMRYKKIKSHDITVVFDGHKSGGGTENMSVSGGVKVIYSRLGERADDVIKRIVSNERKEWIVVSNDRDIVNHAWSADSIPVPSEKFFEIVSKRSGQAVSWTREYHDADLSYKDSEYDDYPNAQKGNPYRLSKKEKTIRRALGKL